jgi:hypothetical protein
MVHCYYTRTPEYPKGRKGIQLTETIWLREESFVCYVTIFLCKIFNFVSYANITGVTSHRIMTFWKRNILPWSNIFTNKYRGLITSYEINTYIQGQFLSFLDTYSSRKLYFYENSLCDVMSHRWYLHMKQSWISWKGSKLPKFYKINY